MKRKSLKLVDESMMPRVWARADRLFEAYVRDWARVIEWRLAGNVGYPSGGGESAGGAKVSGISAVATRYLDVERMIGPNLLVRRLLERMYVGVGGTVRGYVQDTERDRDMVGLLVGVYERMIRRWRRASMASLGLLELAALDVGAVVHADGDDPLPSRFAIHPPRGGGMLPSYGAATEADYEALRRRGVLV